MDMNAGLQQLGTPLGPIMGCLTDMPITYLPSPESALTYPLQGCHDPFSCCKNAPTIIFKQEPTIPQKPDRPKKEEIKIQLTAPPASKSGGNVGARPVPLQQASLSPYPERKPTKFLKPATAIADESPFGAPPFYSSPVVQKSVSPGRIPEEPSIKVGERYRFPGVGSPLPLRQFYQSQDFNIPPGLSETQQARAAEMKQYAFNAQRSYNRLYDLQYGLYNEEGKCIRDEEEKKRLEGMLKSYLMHTENARKHFQKAQKLGEQGKPQ